MSRWRLCDGLIGVLIALLIFTVWAVFLPKDLDDVRGRSGDFIQFYMAGLMVDRGEADRLYDQAYFRESQLPLTDEPMSSLYPPTLALVMAPLSRLSYRDATIAWWIVQAACFLGSGWMLYRMMTLPRRWRLVAMLALSASMPVWAAVRMSHLVPLLLVLLVGGLTLHRRGNRGWAGLVLSALAMKPQLVVGILLWMLVRRDVRTIAGMAAGLAAQALVIAAAVGPAVGLNYLHAMPAITEIARLSHRYSEVLEQSFAGIARNLLWSCQIDKGIRLWVVLLAHITTAGAAAVLLVRMVWTNQPWRPRQLPAYAEQYEYACAVLFTLLFSPYLLMYDMTLLAVPLVLLWSGPSWRTGIALYASVTLASTVLYLGIGFSLTGIVALWVLFEAAAVMKRLRRSPQPPICSPAI